MKKLIFLSSPFTTDDQNLKNIRIQNLKDVMGAFLSYGFHVISPILHNLPILEYLDNKNDFSIWKEYCFNILSRCDEVWVFKDEDWTESIGVREEIKFAHMSKIPVRYFRLNKENNIEFEEE